MPIALIQTDIYTFIAMVAGAFFLGAALSWYLLWRRRQRKVQVQLDPSNQEQLYLVFSRLSHRLKTAGEVIRGHLHGFRDELPQDAERWRVARRAIAEESAGIDSHITRLDLIVRLGMAEQPLVFEPVNVPGLLEDLMVDLGPAADERGVTLGGIVVKSVRDIPHISADQMALREVFSNLLENSVKYSGQGSEIIAEVKENGSHLQVRISDNGRGMSSETLASLFEAGNRGYRPGAAKGTGMGLRLSKLLIDLHGGEIKGRSAEGKGAEFQVLLPLRRASR